MGTMQAAPVGLGGDESGPPSGADPSTPGQERRRSNRVSLSIPVRLTDAPAGTAGLEGAELVNLVDLSLGGASLECASRLPIYLPRRMSLSFGGASAELTVLPYHSWLHQLYYSPTQSSRVLYRARVTFPDPPVPALNLIYRILLAHWSRDT